MNILYIKNEASRVLKENEIELFALWAFGPSYNGLSNEQLLAAWNLRHDHHLFIKLDTDVRQSIKFMLGKWLQQEEDKKAKPWDKVEVRWSESD